MRHALARYLNLSEHPADQESHVADVLAHFRHYATTHGVDFRGAVENPRGYEEADNENDPNAN